VLCLDYGIYSINLSALVSRMGREKLTDREAKLEFKLSAL